MGIFCQMVEKREKRHQDYKGIFLLEGTNSRGAPKTFYCPQIPFAPRILLLGKHLLTLLIPTTLSLFFFLPQTTVIKARTQEKVTLLLCLLIVTELEGPTLGVHMTKVARIVLAQTGAWLAHSSFCSWGPLTWHCTLLNKQTDWAEGIKETFQAQGRERWKQKEGGLRKKIQKEEERGIKVGRGRLEQMRQRHTRAKEERPGRGRRAGGRMSECSDEWGGVAMP